MIKGVFLNSNNVSFRIIFLLLISHFVRVGAKNMACEISTLGRFSLWLSTWLIFITWIQEKSCILWKAQFSILIKLFLLIISFKSSLLLLIFLCLICQILKDVCYTLLLQYFKSYPFISIKHIPSMWSFLLCHS